AGPSEKQLAYAHKLVDLEFNKPDRPSPWTPFGFGSEPSVDMRSGCPHPSAGATRRRSIGELFSHTAC
ncbi:hypothetical protein LH464_23990, partial [Neorhizobium sp. T786]|uniref:hypothetical protein n=1 Tax=Pseudorhizobium xiangyangii TaxID=2883104 RepID=UPI001CFF60A7